MASDTLQLMLSGPVIAAADFSLEYPGVNIDSQVRLDSDNYKFLYLTVSPDACPGRLEFGYTLGGRKGRLAYELKPRDRRPRGSMR